jgi:hypothetical protein
VVWVEGDLGVNRSQCFITGILPVGGWVGGLEEKTLRIETIE